MEEAAHAATATTPAPFARRRRLDVTLALFCTAGVLPIVASYVELPWAVALAGHAVVPAALAMSALAALAGFARRPRLAAYCLAIAVGHGLLVAPLYLPAAASTGDGARLRLVMVNLNIFNRRHDRMRQWLRRERADVVALFELNARWRAALQPELGRFASRIEIPREDAYGVGLYARHALLHDRALESLGTPVIAATTTVRGAELSLLAVHPVPPISGARARSRDQQLRALIPTLRSLKRPVVLVGDLNTTSWSPVFRDLVSGSGLHDTRAGFGVHGTWPAAWPALLRIPIDHVLVSPGVRTVRRAVGPWLGSDHRPVGLELVLPRAPAPSGCLPPCARLPPA